MAASHNVSQQDVSRKSPVNRTGVLTLTGYGIQVRVNRGHLLIEDGIGGERRQYRFPRIGHGLKRLIVIGSDGMVSLAALRWLADQKAAFVMLERVGRSLSLPARSDRQTLAFGAHRLWRFNRETLSG